jgi:hypothetical protein
MLRLVRQVSAKRVYQDLAMFFGGTPSSLPVRVQFVSRSLTGMRI